MLVAGFYTQTMLPDFSGLSRVGTGVILILFVIEIPNNKKKQKLASSNTRISWNKFYEIPRTNFRSMLSRAHENQIFQMPNEGFERLYYLADLFK